MRNNEQLTEEEVADIQMEIFEEKAREIAEAKMESRAECKCGELID